jgi:ribosome-binding factor A
MAGYGIQRLQELIRHRAATVLLRDINDPRIRLVTITRVKLDRDLALCRIYWSTLESGGPRTAIVRGMEDARGFIQREVARILRTRRTPRIELVFDESIEGMERMSRLIQDAREEDRARALARGDSLDEGEDREAEEPQRPDPPPLLGDGATEVDQTSGEDRRIE